MTQHFSSSRLPRVLAFATVFAVASHAVALTPENDSVLHVAGHLITDVAALAIGVFALVHSRKVERDAAIWVVFGLGLLSWFASTVYHLIAVPHLHGTHPWNIGDAFALGYFAATFAVLFLLVRSRFPQRGPALLMDAALATLVMVALGAAVVFAPLFGQPGDHGVADFFVTFSQPLFDLLVAAVLLGALGFMGWRLHPGWLAAGALVATNALIEAIGLRVAAAEIQVLGRMFDSLCPAALLALGYLAAHPQTHNAERRTDGWQLLGVPAVIAACAVLLDIYGRLTGSPNWLSTGLVAVTLIVVAARMLVAFQENAHLLRKSRIEALTDALTGLGNRRSLTEDLTRLERAPDAVSRILVLFDLDGFKSYNDTFGHPAGDELLKRLGRRLTDATAPYGVAYRLGGDEFCLLASADDREAGAIITRAATALSEHGDGFRIGSSYGVVVMPSEARDATSALQLADQRMYQRKDARPDSAQRQSIDVLRTVLKERDPDLGDHTDAVGALAVAVGEAIGLDRVELAQLRRAADLHDIGKLAIPDSILRKPAPLDDSEWQFMRRHTVIGGRILAAVPALESLAAIVRSSHERYDGRGYPDGLAAGDIPLAARIVFVCDSFDAMTSDRPYNKAMSVDAAVEEIRRCAGTQFDPEVASAFVDVMQTWREDAAADRRDDAASDGLTRSGSTRAAIG